MNKLTAFMLTISTLMLTICAGIYKNTKTLQVNADTTEITNLKNYYWYGNENLTNFPGTNQTIKHINGLFELTSTETQYYDFIIINNIDAPTINYNGLTSIQNVWTRENKWKGHELRQIKFLSDQTNTEIIEWFNNNGTLSITDNKLATPTIRKDGNKIYFENIDNRATTINLTQTLNKEETVQQLDITITEIQITEPGYYSIYLTDNTETYQRSNESNIITNPIRKLITPHISKNYNTLLFTDIDEKANYILIYKNNQHIDTIESTTRSYDITDESMLGTYKILTKYSTSPINSQDLYTLSNYSNEYTVNEIETTYNAEVIDIGGLMLQILSMPWTFISKAFDLTIFPNTPYEINFANIFKGLIAILTILFIVRLFTNGFNAIGNISNNASDQKWKKEQRKMETEKHKMAKEKHNKEMKE